MDLMPESIIVQSQAQVGSAAQPVIHSTTGKELDIIEGTKVSATSRHPYTLHPDFVTSVADLEGEGQDT